MSRLGRFGVLLVLPCLLACLWDYDTLQMERGRFPDTLELITGKFLRHSPEFYQWRIEDRKKKLEADPSNLAWYDDLAVAYDKTKQHDKAIETILAKDKLKPGLYETEANLGTFLIHSGRLEEGVKHIECAIQINPNAHFGREKYQKKLVEYVLKRREERGDKLPLAMVVEGKASFPWEDFARFLRGKQLYALSEWERTDALKGLQGMMKFGHYDSPILLEALGSLLSSTSRDDPEDDANRLAVRAFLKASYEVKDPAASTDYRHMATQVLTYQAKNPRNKEQLELEKVEQAFQRELQEGREWYAALEQNERAWIRDGKDPEKEFDQLYFEKPAVSHKEEDESAPTPSGLFAWMAKTAMGLGLLIIAVPVGLLFWKRRANRSSTKPRRGRP